MKILVTGGSGFIGSHLVDKLIEDGHQVTILDIIEPPQWNVKFIKGSIISQDDAVKGCEGIEVVYHLAGLSNIDLVIKNPLQTIELNILGTAYLLEAARKNNLKRFIYASSVYVHDKRGHLYTTSKLASEMLCKDYFTLYSLPYTILRYGTAYGPRSRKADVVSIFVAKALEEKTITVFGSGNQKRNFTYVEDMALGSVAALNDISKNKTYVIADKKAVSVRELANMVDEVFNNQLKINIDTTNEREDDYQGEIDGLEETRVELKWQPKTNLVEGIKKYKDWYLQSAKRL